MRQTIVKTGSFDASHRLLEHPAKCRNLHGHLYSYEIELEFETMKKIGYAMDFSELKKIVMGYIDQVMDHATIVNPVDDKLLNFLKSENSTHYVMSLFGVEFCNPTAENMAKEIFLSVEALLSFMASKCTVKKIRLYETPTSYTDCTRDSVHVLERKYFNHYHGVQIRDYYNELR